jgi:hypothetical protein
MSEEAISPIVRSPKPAASPVTPSPAEEHGQVTITSPDVDPNRPIENGLEFLRNELSLGEAAKHFEMPALLAEINAFLEGELGLKTEATYGKALTEFVTRLKLRDGVDVYTKVERLASLLRIERKLKEIEREKEELRTKNPEEMSSAQLRRRIEMDQDGSARNN